MKQKNVKENIFFNVLKTLFSVIYPIITFTYVARRISVEHMGMVSFSKNITSYFVLLATLGINYYGIREAARVRYNKRKLSKLFWEIFTINIISTTFSFVGMIICIFRINSLEIYKELLLINACSVVLGGIGGEWIISALEEFRFMAIRSIVIQFFCIMSVFLLIHTDGDYLKYAILLVIAGYGGTILNYIFVIRHRVVEWICPREWNLKVHFKPILILFAMYISIELYTVLDTTMLGFIKGDRSVGIYSAAIKVPRLINSLISAIGAVLVPRLSYYYEQDKVKFSDYIKRSIKIVALLSIPCATATFMLPEGIILLLCGEQYHDAIITTRILSLLILIIPISVLFNNQIFIPMRKEIYVLQGTVMGAVVNIALNIVLIPILAENGAAIASVIAELVVMCICLFHVKMELGKLDIVRNYMKQCGKTFVIAMIIMVVSILIKNEIIRLLIAIAVSVPIYFLLCRKDIKCVLNGFEE